MAKNESVERQKTADAKRQKTKDARRRLEWVYVTHPEDRYVTPNEIKRLHAPLDRSLTFEPEYQDHCLHLRSCVQGVDANGRGVKTLYCTRDGRFFVRNKDGWGELQPGGFYRSGKMPKGDHHGTTNAPQMSDYGDKYCHRCVAVAWCNPPEQVKATINDQDAERIYEVDHLNGDHKNWTADNLQWVTAAENRRRAKITRAMRAADDDPKLHTREELLRIFTENNVAGDVYEGED